MVANSRRCLPLKRGENQTPTGSDRIFFAAGLLLSVLLMTYGLDLSPGFF